MAAAQPASELESTAIVEESAPSESSPSEDGKYNVEDSQIAAAREALSADEASRCNEQMIRQFIRATRGDLKQSIKRLHETLAWRAATNPEKSICSICLQKPNSHYMHIVGFDLVERPVFYSCFQMVSNREVEANRMHMIATFEQAIRMMPAGVEQWVWVADFQGFGLSDCNPMLANAFLEISAKHYPERLGVFMVVGAPTVFGGLWRMLQPLIDANTKRKIKLVPYDVHNGDKSKLRAQLTAKFDSELSGWMLREMAENRDKLIRPHKVYSYDDLAELSHGGPDAIPPRSPHDFRGSARFLGHIAGQPHLLNYSRSNPSLAYPDPADPAVAAAEIAASENGGKGV